MWISFCGKNYHKKIFKKSSKPAKNQGKFVDEKPGLW